MWTLTRTEVARRLGKSIATVRRLEYRVLFPSRDDRGVFRFNEAEVERVRRDPASLKLFGRSSWFEERERVHARRRRETPAASRDRRKEPPAAAAVRGTQLANDLQATLYALLLRFGAQDLRTCGLDTELFTRAFDAVQRLRNSAAKL